MFLKNVHLKNFRNVRDQFFEACPNFNFIVGQNAQGKTNIIESIYLMAAGSSFRTSDFRNMMMRGFDNSSVDMETSSSAGLDNVKAVLRTSGKEFYRNSKRARTGGSRILAAVLFAPEEILMLKDVPAVRRRYMDILISMVRPAYAALVKNYSKIISQRNRLLADENLSDGRKIAQLKPWDLQLVETGSRIFLERKIWSEELNKILPERYKSIAPKDGRAIFLYKPLCGEKVISNGEEFVRLWFVDQMNRRRSDELTRRVSLVGPHRDDFDAMVGGRSLGAFGSQGQHRTFVLALKISEMDFIERKTGETPVLLLDDVMSELDSDRRKFLLEYLRNMKGQVFITSTDVDDAAALSSGNIMIFDVSAGMVSPRNPANINICQPQIS